MSSSYTSYPDTEHRPYSSGGGIENTFDDWSSELFGQEPLSLDLVFELYEQGGNFGSDDAVSSGDEPPSALWEFVMDDLDAFDNMVGDTFINEKSIGEQYPISEDEYLELFGEPHPNFSHVVPADLESSSSEADAGEESSHGDEEPPMALPFQPNRPLTLPEQV